MELIKEEYLVNDRIIKIIHREDGSRAKLHALQSNITPYPYFRWNPLALSWQTNNISFSYNVLQKLHFNALNYTSLLQRQVQNPYMMINKDIKDATPQLSSASSTHSVKTEDQIPVKILQEKQKKKSIRVSACKNYIGLLCAGFARTLLTADKGSQVLNYIKELLNHRKNQYDSLKDLTEEELMKGFRDYIYKSMCGKKIKKSNRERDFKTRNTEELDSLLIRKEGDDDITCLRKEVLKEMVNYFFNSDCYNQWLSKGMISETNRFFFLNNKEEIQKKFQNPAFYKPRFNHVSSEDL